MLRISICKSVQSGEIGHFQCFWIIVVRIKCLWGLWPYRSIPWLILYHWFIDWTALPQCMALRWLTLINSFLHVQMIIGLSRIWMSSSLWICVIRSVVIAKFSIVHNTVLCSNLITLVACNYLSSFLCSMRRYAVILVFRDGTIW